MKISNKSASISLVVALAAVCASPLYAGSYFGKNKAPKTDDVIIATDAASTDEDAPEVVVEEVSVQAAPMSEIDTVEMEAPTAEENFDPSEGVSTS